MRYELWVWDSVNEWQQLGGDNLSGTTYTHTGVTAGTTYYYTGERRPMNRACDRPRQTRLSPALTAEATESAVSWTAVDGRRALRAVGVGSATAGAIGGNSSDTTYTHSGYSRDDYYQ